MAKQQRKSSEGGIFVSDISFSKHGSPGDNGVLHTCATLGTLESLDVPKNFLFATQKPVCYVCYVCYPLSLSPPMPVLQSRTPPAVISECKAGGVPIWGSLQCTGNLFNWDSTNCTVASHSGLSGYSAHGQQQCHTFSYKKEFLREVEQS